MERATGSIFAGIQPGSPETAEQVLEILSQPGLRIERIVSTGQMSPPGFWYDQAWDEWVIVLKGAARLRFEDECDARALGPGDFVYIAAYSRHRVDWTALDEPTVWLAVHRHMPA